MVKNTQRTHTPLKARSDRSPKTGFSTIQQWLIGLACLSFFFVIYWIGKTFVQWFN